MDLDRAPPVSLPRGRRPGAVRGRNRPGGRPRSEPRRSGRIARSDPAAPLRPGRSLGRPRPHRLSLRHVGGPGRDGSRGRFTVSRVGVSWRSNGVFPSASRSLVSTFFPLVLIPTLYVMFEERFPRTITPIEDDGAPPRREAHAHGTTEEEPC